MNGVVRRGALPVLIALLAGMLAALPSSAAPMWLAPSEWLSPDGAHPTEPQVAMNAAGDVVAVWQGEYDGGTKRIIQARVHPAGGTWSSSVDLSADPGTAVEPQVAIDAAGNATAVWRTDVVPSQIQATYRPAGGSWSAPVPISDPSMAARLPKLAVDPAGNAVAIWKNDGNGKVMAASRGAGGGAWTLYEEPLADSPIIQSNPDPRLALTMTPGGVAVAAWTFAVLFDRDVVQVSTLPLGGEWSDPETVSAMGVDGYDIDLASSPSGAVVIAWQHISGDTGEEFIQARILPSVGSAWGDTEDVSTPSTDAGEPEAGIDAAGNATVVWRRYDPVEDRDFVQTASRPAGGDWSDAEDLSGLEVDASGQDLAIAGSGAAVAVWLETTGDPATDNIVRTSRRPAGGVWTAPQDLTSGPTVGLAPHVGTDADGDAVAVWQVSDPSAGPIQIRGTGFDASPPELSGLSIPATGTVGQPVTTTVTAKDTWSTVSILWTFGDGTTGSGASVTKIYSAAGTYGVSVTATDAVGNTTTRTGSVVVAPGSNAVVPKPALTGVKLTKKTIHVLKSDEKPRATKLKLTLNVDAKVVVKLKRTQKVKGKAVKAKLAKSLDAGKRVIRLTSKVGGKKLPPGTYKVTVFAKNAAGKSAPKTVRLKIVS